MAYDTQNTYNKFRFGGHGHDHKEGGCGCGSKDGGCGCKSELKCSCCPAGLVEVQDKDGKVIGCLSPNDAQEYMTNTFRCPDGYIRVIGDDGEFIGCLTPEEFAAYKTALG